MAESMRHQKPQNEPWITSTFRCLASSRLYMRIHREPGGLDSLCDTHFRNHNHRHTRTHTLQTSKHSTTATTTTAPAIPTSNNNSRTEEVGQWAIARHKCRASPSQQFQAPVCHVHCRSRPAHPRPCSTAHRAIDLATPSTANI